MQKELTPNLKKRTFSGDDTNEIDCKKTFRIFDEIALDVIDEIALDAIDEKANLLQELIQEKPCQHLRKRFEFLSTLPDYEFFNVCIKASNSWSYQMFIPLFLAAIEEQKEKFPLRVLRTLVYLMDLKLIDEWYKVQTHQEREEGVEDSVIGIFRQFLELPDWDYFERLIRAHCTFSIESPFQPLRSRLIEEEKLGSIREETLDDIFDAYCKV